MPGEIWFDTSDKNMTETTGGSGERAFGWCKEMADSREAQMIIKCKFLNLHQSMQIARSIQNQLESSYTLSDSNSSKKP